MTRANTCYICNGKAYHSTTARWRCTGCEEVLSACLCTPVKKEKEYSRWRGKDGKEEK